MNGELSPYPVAGIELVVFSFLGDEFVVRATLNDTALFQNDDTIAVSHSGETVCNNEGGTSAHERVHTPLHHSLCSSVDG